MNAAKLEAIRDECFAEDIDLPDESIGWTKWTEDAARAFFESGGNAQAAAAVMGSATSPASSSAAPSLPTPPPAAPVAPAAPVSPARAAEPSLQPSIYRVAHAYVNVRDAPNLMGNILGKKCEGDELEAVARGGGDASLDWIRLRETFEGDRAGWLLVNGLKAGMAKAELLTRVSGPPPPAHDDVIAAAAASPPAAAAKAGAASPAPASTAAVAVRLAAPMAYVVEHAFVRPQPSDGF